MLIIYLPKLDKDLLAECAVETFRSSGSGGQHVNVTNSAVRLKHLPSGIAVSNQTERSQYLNKKKCLEKLREKVRKLNYKKPKRVSTSVPRSVKLKNRVKKKKTSETKRLRRKPNCDAES